MESKRNYDFTNTKLIIGNGFDLNCGIKSRYTDFFNENSENFNNLDAKNDILKFGSSFGDYINKNVDWPYKDDHFEYLKSKFNQCNTWFVYFSLCARTNLKNWFDVESEIKKSFLDSAVEDSNLESIIKTRWINKYKDKSYRNITFWGLVCALVIGEITNYYGISKNILSMATFIRKIKGTVINNESSFYNYLFNELKEFETYFGKYIEYASNANWQEVSIKQYSLLDRLPAKFTSIDTFNYDSLQYDIGNVPLRHINGTVKNPIFGFDDPKITFQDPRYIFTKTYRHMEMAINMPIEIPCNNFDNIVIYGHSLSSNDYNYFFPILDRLDMGNPATSEKKAIFAYSVYESKREAEIKLDVLTGIIKLFEAYSEYKGLGKTSRLHDQLSVSGKILIYQVPEN